MLVAADSGMMCAGICLTQTTALYNLMHGINHTLKLLLYEVYTCKSLSSLDRVRCKADQNITVCMTAVLQTSLALSAPCVCTVSSIQQGQLLMLLSTVCYGRCTQSFPGHWPSVAVTSKMLPQVCAASRSEQCQCTSQNHGFPSAGAPPHPSCLLTPPAS